MEKADSPDLRQLPEADAFGNFRFGDPKDLGAPALLHSSVAGWSGTSNGYMIFLGADRGFVWDKDDKDRPRLLKVEDPRKALKELRQRLGIRR